MKVLLVDDSAFMRHILKQIMEAVGHEVIGEAEDGQMGIDLYRQLSPDVVFMDITMPGITGVDALKGIRTIDAKANVIMCSAMGQQWLVMEAIKAGACEFIVKPFKPEQVIYTLNKLLRTFD